MRYSIKTFIEPRNPVLFALVAVLSALITVSAFAVTPQVRVKVAEYPHDAALVMPAGGSWSFAGKKGSIGKRDICSIHGVLRSPAVKKFHVMVESVALREPGKLEETLAKWRATGRPVHTFPIGRISYAADGRTVSWDGRVAMIGVGVFDGRDPAQALVDELAKVGSSSWILEEVVSPARGVIELKIDRRSVARGEGVLTLTPIETATLRKVEYAKGFSWHGWADRVFRGPMTVAWGAQDALDVVLATDLETILAGVVPAEISSKAAIGALQAQATAARGEILGKMGMHHIGENFDFCSEQHCQVYSGESAESKAMARAIAPTRGYLLHGPDGGIVDAVYAANCGGHSEASHLVWTTPPDPILGGIWDTQSPSTLDLSTESDVAKYILNPPPCWCASVTVEGAEKFRWKKTLAGGDWTKVVEACKIGRIKDVKDFARGVSGRLYRVTLVGENGTRSVMKELPIRKLFGGLRSACFIVSWKRDADGFITGGEFTGAGWGHGVGMCQTGAQAMAGSGVSFPRILSHYFPGSRLVKVY
ncbi:MAG: SpoIID/LytB domain-containing protein [Candidatus Riflebacteria bacterium]|nr:SpoIID/LytB domain-containing protein [Candidatus Riflebacteria bacterium]